MRARSATASSCRRWHWAVPSHLTTGSIVRGVGVITLDIGTGVRVSVPTAILASLTFAARNGILMRSGRGLEQLAQVDTIVFDKTGTLTQGKAGVVGIYTEYDGSSPRWRCSSLQPRPNRA
jgi:P-type E1-E2 ATPase